MSDRIGGTTTDNDKVGVQGPGNKSTLMADLEGAIAATGGSRARRLLRQPLRLPTAVVLERIARASSRPIERNIRTFWGADMTVVIPETVSRRLARWGFWEEDLTRYVLGFLEPGMTFLDVGAHFGYFSLLALEIVGPNGRVQAVEPSPWTFEILTRNLRRHPNAHATEAALWSEEGSLHLNDFGAKWSGFNSVYPPRLGSSDLPSQRFEVDAFVGDDYLDRNEITADFIKIDAESAEMAILQGLTKTLEKNRPVLTLEVGDFDLEGVPSSRELLEYAMGFGYRMYHLEEGAVVPHRLADSYRFENILLIPAEREDALVSEDRAT